MCASMTDIQSAMADIRRGKKDRKKKPQGKNIISASATHGGHNKYSTISIIFGTDCRQRGLRDLIKRGYQLRSFSWQAFITDSLVLSHAWILHCNRSYCSVWLGSAFLTKNKVDTVVTLNQYLDVRLQLFSAFCGRSCTFEQCSFKYLKNNFKVILFQRFEENCFISFLDL